METAIVAGGCFWCMEAIYRRLLGVEEVVSGFIGGNVVHPTYKQVCNEETGHAEAVQITFDSQLITYMEILEIFWQAHDPTSLNQQGDDIGTQYRSVIFYTSEAQHQQALLSREQAQKLLLLKFFLQWSSILHRRIITRTITKIILIEAIVYSLLLLKSIRYTICSILKLNLNTKQ